MDSKEHKKRSPIPGIIEALFILAIASAVFILFSLRGNNSHAATEGASLLRWIDWQWRPANQDFSHGWFMLAGVLAFSDWRLKGIFYSKFPWFLRTGIFLLSVTACFLLTGLRDNPGNWESLLPMTRAIPYLRIINWLLFFVLFLYQSWLFRQSVQKPSRGHITGISALTLSLILHWAMFWAQQPRISLVTLTGTLWSISFALYGWETAKFMLFPIGYMLICFLAWFLNAITMPLRLVASAIAEVIINGIGIEIIRSGTVICSATPGQFSVNVADACSGLRSLSMMTALAAPYAYFTIHSVPRRWILFAASIPLAMLANAMRVVLLTGCAAWLSDDWFKMAHDYSGFIIFFISLLLLFAAGSALNVDYIKKFRTWKKNVTSRTPSA